MKGKAPPSPPTSDSDALGSLASNPHAVSIAMFRNAYVLEVEAGDNIDDCVIDQQLRHTFFYPGFMDIQSWSPDSKFLNNPQCIKKVGKKIYIADVPGLLKDGIDYYTRKKASMIRWNFKTTIRETTGQACPGCVNVLSPTSEITFPY